MSGKNFSVLALQPGIFSDSTQYGTGKHWFDGNLVRWLGDILIPIGGWRSIANFGAAPVLNVQTPPAVQLGNVTGPGVYTFAAAPLGASVGKRVIVGAFVRFNANPVNAPVITVAGVNCSPLYTAGLVSNFANLYISDGIVSALTGDIVVNIVSGIIATSCKVYQYEYIGPDPTVNDASAAATGQFASTTTPLVVPPKSKGLAISTAFIANDPITWIWAGSTVDNSDSNAENSTSMAQISSSGLNTVNEIITQTGTLSAARHIRTTLLPEVIGAEPIRDMVSWRDNLKAPWLAAGSSDKLWGLSVNPDSTYTSYNITPTTLAWNPGGLVGWGGGAWGEGPWGLDNDTGTITPDRKAQWSMDSFGKLLIAVHSQDGRLFTWDPATPATIAAVVAQAPVDNTLCIMSNEEFLFVMGGKNNPRRVKWASQRTTTDWTATATNSAGGFDLQSHGTIKSCVKVPEGILVITDADVHLIQYIGAPNYYGRRKISDEGSIVGKNALVPVPNGAIWMGNSDFWSYTGGNALRMPCSVHTDAFYKSELSDPSKVFLGVNEFAGEIWAFFPLKGSAVTTNYVAYNYSEDNYWTKGELSRTSWLNPVWQPKPLAAIDQTLYEQEFGALADGLSRNGEIFAETGAIEIGEGDDVMRVDRIYPDAGEVVAIETGGYGTGLYGENLYGQGEDTIIPSTYAFDALFKLRQAPGAVERIEGPINLFSDKGYVNVRFRARQMVMRITQVQDSIWTLGKLRLRLKAGGRR